MHMWITEYKFLKSFKIIQNYEKDNI
jgi:hypothetical protein